jgi:hypothetical protein
MNRKFLVAAVVVALAFSPAIGIGTAEAHGGGGGGFAGRGFHGGGFERGFFGGGIGFYNDGAFALYGDEYGYVYPQAYPSLGVAAASAQSVWYFCQPTKTYYPYVQSCSVPWQAVPAIPAQ